MNLDETLFFNTFSKEVSKLQEKTEWISIILDGQMEHVSKKNKKEQIKDLQIIWEVIKKWYEWFKYGHFPQKLQA